MSDKVTIKDVAREAGVGVGTVSRYINENGYVKAETGAKIKAAIARTGFRANIFAAGLRGASSSTVGVMVPDIGNSLFAELISSLENRLRKVGRSIVLASPSSDPAQEVEVVAGLVSRGVESLVLIPCVENNKDLADYVGALNLPIAVLDRYFLEGNSGVGHVLTDHRAGLEIAFQKLLKAGHKDILMFVFNNDRPGIERETALRTMADQEEQGDLRVRIVSGSKYADRVKQTIQDLSCAKDLPEAIIVGHNLLLPAVLSGLREVPAVVGTDISLVCFDRVSLCDFHTPPIATIWRDMDAIGLAAFEVLEKLKMGKDFVDPIHISTDFHSTESVRALR